MLRGVGSRLAMSVLVGVLIEGSASLGFGVVFRHDVVGLRLM